MAQIMRCAWMMSCLVSAGCGWLATRDQGIPRPAPAQEPPAGAQQPPAPAEPEPSDTDPFAAPASPMVPAPEMVGPALRSPLDAGLPPEANLASPPAAQYVAGPAPRLCQCPRCRRSTQKNGWWHKLWPRRRDDDGDGYHDVLCEHCLAAHMEAMERVLPPGTFLHAAMETQIANGDAAEMMLYDYDFLPGTAVLSPRGRRQVRHLLGLMMSVPSPLRIQATPGAPELAIARRTAVLSELERIGAPVPAESLLISEPLTRGLDGLNAIRIHDRVLEQQAGGAPGAGVPATPSPTISYPGP